MTILAAAGALATAASRHRARSATKRTASRWYSRAVEESLEASAHRCHAGKARRHLSVDASATERKDSSDAGRCTLARRRMAEKARASCCWRCGRGSGASGAMIGGVRARQRRNTVRRTDCRSMHCSSSSSEAGDCVLLLVIKCAPHHGLGPAVAAVIIVGDAAVGSILFAAIVASSVGRRPTMAGWPSDRGASGMLCGRPARERAHFCCFSRGPCSRARLAIIALCSRHVCRDARRGRLGRRTGPSRNSSAVGPTSDSKSGASAASCARSCSREAAGSIEEDGSAAAK